MNQDTSIQRDPNQKKELQNQLITNLLSYKDTSKNPISKEILKGLVDKITVDKLRKLKEIGYIGADPKVHSEILLKVLSSTTDKDGGIDKEKLNKYLAKLLKFKGAVGELKVILKTISTKEDSYDLDLIAQNITIQRVNFLFPDKTESKVITELRAIAELNDVKSKSSSGIDVKSHVFVVKDNELKLLPIVIGPVSIESFIDFFEIDGIDRKELKAEDVHNKIVRNILRPGLIGDQKAEDAKKAANKIDEITKDITEYDSELIKHFSLGLLKQDSGNIFNWLKDKYHTEKLPNKLIKPYQAVFLNDGDLNEDYQESFNKIKEYLLQHFPIQVNSITDLVSNDLKAFKTLSEDDEYKEKYSDLKRIFFEVKKLTDSGEQTTTLGKIQNILTTSSVYDFRKDYLKRETLKYSSNQEIFEAIEFFKEFFKDSGLTSRATIGKLETTILLSLKDHPYLITVAEFKNVLKVITDLSFSEKEDIFSSMSIQDFNQTIPDFIKVFRKLKAVSENNLRFNNENLFNLEDDIFDDKTYIISASASSFIFTSEIEQELLSQLKDLDLNQEYFQYIPPNRGDKNKRRIVINEYFKLGLINPATLKLIKNTLEHKKEAAKFLKEKTEESKSDTELGTIGKIEKYNQEIKKYKKKIDQYFNFDEVHYNKNSFIDLGLNNVFPYEDKFSDLSKISHWLTKGFPLRNQDYELLKETYQLIKEIENEWIEVISWRLNEDQLKGLSPEVFLNYYIENLGNFCFAQKYSINGESEVEISEELICNGLEFTKYDDQLKYLTPNFNNLSMIMSIDEKYISLINSKFPDHLDQENLLTSVITKKADRYPHFNLYRKNNTFFLREDLDLIS